jgi:hypothetical protein
MLMDDLFTAESEIPEIPPYVQKYFIGGDQVMEDALKYASVRALQHTIQDMDAYIAAHGDSVDVDEKGTIKAMLFYIEFLENVMERRQYSPELQVSAQSMELINGEEQDSDEEQFPEVVFKESDADSVLDVVDMDSMLEEVVGEKSDGELLNQVVDVESDGEKSQEVVEMDSVLEEQVVEVNSMLEDVVDVKSPKQPSVSPELVVSSAPDMQTMNLNFLLNEDPESLNEHIFQLVQGNAPLTSDEFDGLSDLDDGALDYAAQLGNEARVMERDMERRQRVSQIHDLSTQDIHQLLQLLGIPYVIAPTEAEAQCAQLELQGLVDGTVTEDSDALLFGSRNVYRHVHTRKPIQHYSMSKCIYSREQLVTLAYFLGCDYTTGVKGIGKETAKEIIKWFCGINGLQTFKAWKEAPLDPSEDNSMAAVYKKVHGRALPPGFPDQQVWNTFMNPGVLTDATPFQWGHPNVQPLTKHRPLSLVMGGRFLREKLDWDTDTTQKKLAPLLQERPQPQPTLNTYFTPIKPAPQVIDISDQSERKLLSRRQVQESKTIVLD